MVEPTIKKVDFRAQCMAVKFMYEEFDIPDGASTVNNVCNNANPYINNDTKPADAYFKDGKLLVQKYKLIGNQLYPEKAIPLPQLLLGEPQFRYKKFEDELSAGSPFLPNIAKNPARWNVIVTFENMLKDTPDKFELAALSMYNCLNTADTSIDTCKSDPTVEQALLSSLNEEFIIFNKEVNKQVKSIFSPTFDKDQYEILEWQLNQEPDTPETVQKMIELAQMKLNDIKQIYFEGQIEQLKSLNSNIISSIKDAEPWYTSEFSEKASEAFASLDSAANKLTDSGLALLEKKYIIEKIKESVGNDILSDAAYREPVKEKSKDKEYNGGSPFTFDEKQEMLKDSKKK